MENFEFPFCRGGVHLEEYCKAITQSAKENGCFVIDLYNNISAYDTIDGFHPSVEGMETIAKAILSCIENG
jgi:lysophospholipase L1-like esterase